MKIAKFVVYYVAFLAAAPSFIVSSLAYAQAAPLDSIRETMTKYGTASNAKEEYSFSLQIDRNPDSALAALGRLDDLTLSRITEVTFTTRCTHAQALSVITRMVRLRDLSVCENGWNSTFSEIVAKSTTITSLWCEASGVTAEDLSEIAKAKQLRVLMIGRNHFSGSDLKRLAPLHELRQLSIAHMKLNKGDLQVLTSMKKLYWLDLDSCSVDDNAVPVIGKCKSLRILSLVGTGITQSAVERLAKHLPETIVSWGEK